MFASDFMYPACTGYKIPRNTLYKNVCSFVGYLNNYDSTFEVCKKKQMVKQFSKIFSQRPFYFAYLFRPYEIFHPR